MPGPTGLAGKFAVCVPVRFALVVGIETTLLAAVEFVACVAPETSVMVIDGPTHQFIPSPAGPLVAPESSY